MDIRELRYITEIARAKNMAKAAQALYISQPALHKTLHKAEAELGTALFYRERNELLPTDTGKIVLTAAARIMAEMKQMEDGVLAVKQLQQGTVSLGFPAVVGAVYMPKLLSDFRKQYAHITLQTVEGGSPRLVSLVASGELDTAVVMGPVLSKELNEIPVIRDQVVVGVPPSHPLAGHSCVTIRDLEGVPFNLLAETNTLSERLLQRFREADIKPTVAFTSVSAHFLYELSRLSGDALILPDSIVRSFAGDSMKRIPFEPVYPWEICLIFRKHAFISQAAQALICYMQDPSLYLLPDK